MLLGGARGIQGAEVERLFTDEFARFVQSEEPDAAMLYALGETSNFADARRNWCADGRRVATTVEIRAGYIGDTRSG
jgi:UDP-2,3-diacylglucosamine pyrophosphatase LpxH